MDIGLFTVYRHELTVFTYEFPLIGEIKNSVIKCAAVFFVNANYYINPCFFCCPANLSCIFTGNFHGVFVKLHMEVHGRFLYRTESQVFRPERVSGYKSFRKYYEVGLFLCGPVHGAVGQGGDFQWFLYALPD